jgi:hypothetical protein
VIGRTGDRAASCPLKGGARQHARSKRPTEPKQRCWDRSAQAASRSTVCISRWLQSLERPRGPAQDRFQSVGAESAPSSCPLRPPRGRDPCNQANVAWRASGLSRPLGALAARDPFPSHSCRGSKLSFLGAKIRARAVPLTEATPRGPAGVGKLIAATAGSTRRSGGRRSSGAEGDVSRAGALMGIQSSTPLDPFGPW